MINHENEVYDIVSKALQLEFKDIEIKDEKIPVTQQTFPALSIVQIDNSIVEQYSTFDTLENVVTEIYEFDAVSNLETNRAKQTRDMLSCVDNIMNLLGFTRIAYGPIVDEKENFVRRVVKYKKLYVN